MVIDMHSHDFASSVAARAMSGMCKILGNSLTPSGDGTLENHLDSMTMAGIDMAVLCQIATKPQHFDVIMRRSRAIMSGEFGERARRMIVPFASVHPDDAEWSRHLDEVAASGIRGIKFHPYYQDFSLADPHVWPIFRKAADLGLVIECHAGRDLGYSDRTDACGPREIVALLKNVRGLKFVAAHLGGCNGLPPHATDELLDLGCYIDTSALARNWHRDEEMRLLRSWPVERILFATDFPWVNYSEALNWVKSVRNGDDLPQIFGDNAVRLLRLNTD